MVTISLSAAAWPHLQRLYFGQVPEVITVSKLQCNLYFISVNASLHYVVKYKIIKYTHITIMTNKILVNKKKNTSDQQCGE